MDWPQVRREAWSQFLLTSDVQDAAMRRHLRTPPHVSVPGPGSYAETLRIGENLRRETFGGALLSPAPLSPLSGRTRRRQGANSA